MQILLFDPVERKRLFPLTQTRAVADLLMGILTIKEWWQLKTGLNVSVYTNDYLKALYKQILPDDYLLINSQILVNESLYEKIIHLQKGESIRDERGLIAGRLSLENIPVFGDDLLSLFSNYELVNEITRLDYPSQIFENNDKAIREHFELITAGKKSDAISSTNKIVNPENIFIEGGASVEFSILNASTGPIYIGKNATIMEGCMVRGPFAMCESAVLKMGARVYGATTLGPFCTGGGEIKNSILMGYSNKAHDGYLGDSVIGEWCNFGAGTSNSNVKNTASTVSVYNYYDNKFVASGIKCGVFMGDYSRTAINTSINTGTVIGVCCNVFGEGLTPKFIEDFMWGSKGLSRYEFNKALLDISNWKKLKSKKLNEAQASVLKYIFDK